MIVLPWPNVNIPILTHFMFLFLLPCSLDRPSGKPNEKRKKKPGSNEKIGSSSTGNDSYMVSKSGRGCKNSMGINRGRNNHVRESTIQTIMKMNQKKEALM